MVDILKIFLLEMEIPYQRRFQKLRAKLDSSCESHIPG